jgi:hypothetical protein
LSRLKTSRALFALASGTAALVAVGCLFPDYQNDLPDPLACGRQAGLACVPTPTDGWKGPVAFSVGNQFGSCASPLITIGKGVYYTDIRDEAAECAGCGCVGHSDECDLKILPLPDGCGTIITHNGHADCQQLAEAGSCTEVETQSVAMQAAACDPYALGAASKGLPYGGVATVCGVQGAGTGCDAGTVCAPTGTDCIYADGVQARCPAGYGLPTIVYATVDDERGCTPCSCGKFECKGVVKRSGGSCVMDCEGLPQQAVGTTFTMTGKAQYGFSYCPDAGCEPAGGEPTGQVMVDGGLTVCCPGDAGP